MNTTKKIIQKTAVLLIVFYREAFGRNKAFALFAPLPCRFYPSCSEFAESAILKYGTAKGLWLTVKRLARCTPFGKSGYDPLK